MYRANLIARNLHASSENRRKQERLFEKEILPLGPWFKPRLVHK